MQRAVFVPGMAAPVRIPSPALAITLLGVAAVMIAAGVLMIVFGAGPGTETVERPGLLALGIVTVVLGVPAAITSWILLAIITYQHASDLQRNRARPFDAWQVFFWIGLLLVGPLMWVVYWVNVEGLKELRQRAGLPTSGAPIVAFVFAIIVPPVGSIIWYFHHKATMEEIAARRSLVPIVRPLPTWQATMA